MKILLFLVFINFAHATDRYILPKDIIQARDQLLATKAKLDRDILQTYYNLCQKTSLNEAQYIESLAYREITGMECIDLIFYQHHK